jgi:ATP-dependent Lhr-like helicase
VRGTRRARLTAITCGGAIPDIGHYKVYLDPEGTFIGTVDEDYGIDSVIGDVFQLGNRSWRILRIERGALRVVTHQPADRRRGFLRRRPPSVLAE